MPSPIAVFTYNRPELTKKCISSLQRNKLADQSVLYVFSDGAKNDLDKIKVEETRTFLKQVSGFKEVHILKNEINKGLAQSIIDGTDYILKQYNKIIVIEDDLVAEKNAIQFLNDGLDFYSSQKEIFSLTAYNYPIKIPKTYTNDVYISQRPCSYFWATWKNRWDKVDWQISDFKEFRKNRYHRKKLNRYGNDLYPMLQKQQLNIISSWAIRWAYHHFKNQGYCIYPTKSKVNNLGGDGSGTNTHKTKKFETKTDHSEYLFLKNMIQEYWVEKAYQRFFNVSFIRRIINFIKFEVLLPFIEKA